MRAKILIITDYFYPSTNGGGGQISITNLAKLVSNNHDVKIICRPHDYKSNFKIPVGLTVKHENLEIIYFRVRKFYKIRSIIKKFSPSYIYLNSFFSPLVILFLLFFLNSKSKIIISPKGELYDGALKTKKYKKNIWIFILKKSLKIQNYTFHATSNEEAKIIQKHFPLSKILIARDIPISGESQPLLYNRDKKKKIIFISRLSKKKNLEFAIDIIMQLKSEFTFEIWGAIDETVYFQKCLNKLNNSPKNISWDYKGSFPIGKSVEKFKDSDLFIFPTLGENYGYVILESLLGGCSILLSKGTTPWDDLDNFGVGKNIPLSNIKEWVSQAEVFLSLPNEDIYKTKKKCINYAISKLEIEVKNKENLNLFNLTQ